MAHQWRSIINKYFEVFPKASIKLFCTSKGNNPILAVSWLPDVSLISLVVPVRLCTVSGAW